ncbi:putative nuclease HARBI1 [Lingula anatina]|uniref:Putative nuclease HARBI1 n=1 Tax=Lingula anatina TaxID=7574 RepID=A0A1S3H0I4_LINAN|nr:putative nuclease HARBI1 [Lingula anatina]|eukprot:XP_013379513.1 putative nuclease HARBI1 [Lingula anatina]
MAYLLRFHRNPQQYNPPRQRRERTFRREVFDFDGYTDSELRARFRFGREDPREKATIRRGFFRIARFPGVIGCLDGTHIRITAPTLNEPAFVNRKNYHSLNVQAICDHKGRFTNIVAQWPGSVHDAHIFSTSAVGRHLNQNQQPEDGVLLGDSGYACRPYLMTPYLHPVGRAQRRFNRAHRSTRNLIERVFGMWKKRFGCLNIGFRMAPARVSTIVGACAVLHNIAINLKEPIPDNVQVPADNGDMGVQYQGPQDGRAVRDHLASTYFA